MTTSAAAQPPRWQLGVSVVIGLALVGLITAFFMTALVPAFGLRFDFYPRYVGGQAFWRGESPYSAALTTQIQISMFGKDTGYQAQFIYPPYIAILMAPLLLLPFPLAVSLWMTLQFVGLASMPLIWLRLLGWKLPALASLLLLVALLIGFRYPINAVIIGQFTGLLALCFSLGIAFLLAGRDAWAGIALALATVAPPITGPLVFVILGGYALRGRPKAFLTCAATLIVLSLLAFLRIGWWLPDFIASVRDYPHYARPVWPPSLLDGPLLRLLVIALMGAALVWSARRLRTDALDRQIDFIITALIASLLLLPISGNYYLALLIPAWVACLWKARGNLSVQALIAVLIVSPWLYLSAHSLAPQIDVLLVPLSAAIIWCGLSLRNWLQPA